MSSTVLNIGLGGLVKSFVKTLGLNVSSRFPFSLSQCQNLALKKQVISCSPHGHREGQLESKVRFQSSAGEILSLVFSSTLSSQPIPSVHVGIPMLMVRGPVTYVQHINCTQ